MTLVGCVVLLVCRVCFVGWPVYNFWLAVSIVIGLIFYFCWLALGIVVWPCVYLLVGCVYFFGWPMYCCWLATFIVVDYPCVLLDVRAFLLIDFVYFCWLTVFIVVD